MSWTFLTPDLVRSGGAPTVRSIAAMPGMGWVAFIPAAQMDQQVLQQICDTVNMATGAKPPAPVTTVAPTAIAPNT